MKTVFVLTTGLCVGGIVGVAFGVYLAILAEDWYGAVSRATDILHR